MVFRQADINDITQMHIVRCAVTENRLSNPALISHTDYQTFLEVRGKGWVCEADNQVAGFAIVDLVDENVWALFVHPEYEGKGIGSRLHDIMLDWYFNQGKEYIWLGTAPGTKAEAFYRKHGWIENGMHGRMEIKFEMSFRDWLQQTLADNHD